ncbi:zinc finger CCCH domain-containing protein 49-like [Neltuma alba]|uniref:zinc finger CCCH domain-containing protein 49-like n=1 Tax=Neltuma alba TaxID=207710 RepID=UPI0010A36800|nr:zinc finger CCCH domain-containing protein 49-like [Prosopis alba]
MAGLNVNGYAGVGVGAQAPYPTQPQYQYQYYPYGGYPPQPQQQPPYPPASAPVPTPPGSRHQNSGTESIGGKTEQSGTFKGHGTGASIQGGFTASGSIA